MQLTNTPGKLVLPFANAGAKNTIPTASQIGITAGAASLTDGFPPLTRTPIAAGGVPPSGLDMNGILYELSAILRWANAGGGYAYDAAFATDSNVGGYPKGARIMRSDGLGYWFNTVENNTTDPEAAGAAAAGWVPDFTNGVTSVAMASANVTLTPLQYGKPIIVITGTLTANLNLIFPTIVNEWTVINNTTGPYTITCKTAAGTGLVVNTAALIVGDGTNIQSAITDAAAIFGETVATATGGTADAITATFAPVPRYPSNGIPLSVRATAANATTTPTFTPNSGVIAAATIVKGNNRPLVAGDIAGAGHWLELAWDSTLTKWVLLNPAFGVKDARGLNSYNASTTIQLSDIGKIVTYYGSTAGQTLTLPAANAIVDAGAGFYLVNQATVPVTISRAGADTINTNTYAGNVVANTLILNPGDSVFISSNAASAWNCFGDVILTGNFTITGTGFGSAVTATATYKVIKGVVYLFIPTAAITGTSNATSFTLTGLPAAITPAQTKGLPLALAVDAGNPTWASVSLSNTGVITLNKTGLSASWTASGTKTFNTSELVYQL